MMIIAVTVKAERQPVYSCLLREKKKKEKRETAVAMPDTVVKNS